MLRCELKRLLGLFRNRINDVRSDGVENRDRDSSRAFVEIAEIGNLPRLREADRTIVIGPIRLRQKTDVGKSIVEGKKLSRLIGDGDGHIPRGMFNLCNAPQYTQRVLRGAVERWRNVGAVKEQRTCRGWRRLAQHLKPALVREG